MRRSFLSRALFCGVFLFGFAAFLSAEEIWMLGDRPREGKYLKTFEVTSKSTGTYDIGGDVSLDRTAKAEMLTEIRHEEDGGYTEISFYRKISEKNVAPQGITLEYDSESPEKYDEELQKVFGLFLDARFEIKYGPDKAILSEKGFEELSKKLEELGKLEKHEDVRKRFLRLSEANRFEAALFKEMLRRKPVRIGQSWPLYDGEITSEEVKQYAKGTATLKEVRREDGRAVAAIIETEHDFKQTEPCDQDSDNGRWTISDTDRQALATSRFDLDLHAITHVKRRDVLTFQYEMLSSVETIPDFALNMKTVMEAISSMRPLEEAEEKDAGSQPAAE